MTTRHPLARVGGLAHQEESPMMSRPARTRIHWIVALGVGLILFYLLSNPLLTLLLGWIYFLARVLPAVRLDRQGLVLAGLCLVGSTVGLHWFLRWLTSALSRGPEDPVRAWSWRSSLAVVGLIVLLFVSGISAIGMTHQTIWLATSPGPIFENRGIREVAERMSSSNNLKQLAFAAMNHDEARGHLPAGTTFDRSGQALHSWTTALLPWLEHESLFQQIDQTRPWNDPANFPAMKTGIPALCFPIAPKTDADGWPLIHYAGNVRVLGGAWPVSLCEISDDVGTAQTILFGEAAGNFRPWGQPGNLRDPAGGLNRSPAGFGHPRGPGRPVQFAFADGSVRTFSADTSPEFLEMLADSMRQNP